MNLLRKAALWVPAIRRLRDGRDSLLAERDDLLAKTSSSVAEDPAVVEMLIARAEDRLIVTEYPYHPKSRRLDEAAGGKRLQTRFRSEERQYAATLQGIARHLNALLRIPRNEEDLEEPFWANDWFPPLDGASLYGLIAERAPRRYIEVGSGISTRFARLAIRSLGLATQIVSIDPHPHTVVSGLCDEIVRCRMEDVPRDFWDAIAPDDMLFLDNSHRSFPNSDVTVFFAEVLPGLAPGTVWGLHDVLLPWDYPESWSNRFYNEQYLLLAYLIGGAPTAMRSFCQQNERRRTLFCMTSWRHYGRGKNYSGTSEHMADAFGCDVAPTLQPPFPDHDCNLQLAQASQAMRDCRSL